MCPHHLLQLNWPLIQKLWLFHQTHNLAIPVPGNILSWTWPVELVGLILVHAFHFNIIFNLQDDSWVGLTIVVDNAPLTCCLWCSQAVMVFQCNAGLRLVPGSPPSGHSIHGSFAGTRVGAFIISCTFLSTSSSPTKPMFLNLWNMASALGTSPPWQTIVSADLLRVSPTPSGAPFLWLASKKFQLMPLKPFLNGFFESR